MIKAIIFDFDGVIHNTFSLHLRNFNKFVKNGDLSAEEYRALHDGNIHTLKKSLDKIKDINFTFYRESIFEEYTAQKITAEVNAALQVLAKNYQFFIVSSAGEKILNGYLVSNSINNLFSEVLGVETDNSKKIKFQMILDNYQLQKNEVIFITDTLGDILEANEADIKTIAIDSGFHDRARLAPGRPMAFISSLREVSDIISKL